MSPGTDQALTPRITRSPFTIPDSCSRSKIRYALGTGIPRSVAITAVKADLRATFPLLHEIVYVWSPAGYDEHPPFVSDPGYITKGQTLVWDRVQAVIDGGGWENTTFILTSDDWGGYADSVPTPAVETAWILRRGSNVRDS